MACNYSRLISKQQVHIYLEPGSEKNPLSSLFSIIGDVDYFSLA